MSAGRLVSFDIDGTLECGEPPGIVPVALVRAAKRLGYLVGSCSDRPITFQEALWERLGIPADFTVLKHRLADVRARFAATAYYHVGDTDTDARYALDAGFRFLHAEAAAHAQWAVELFARRSPCVNGD
ncbi:MAG TPA: HAD family hydrolase [Methylomirabilota bacterium]|jgi:phosphoglycolate phosphatase-like HAD superfamily hydrolase|nr:HAD family hydrolase [Methylomirabilota bacterium]